MEFFVLMVLMRRAFSLNRCGGHLVVVCVSGGCALWL